MTLSKEIEIFVFRKDKCSYCQTLEKHLASFAAQYGFKVEAVSADGSTSQYFKTNSSKELIAALDLEVMPTVIAVTNDSALRFELARGAVSIAELEEKALLLFRYLKEIRPEQIKKGQQ